MVNPIRLIKASIDTGRDLLRPPTAGDNPDTAEAPRAPVLVPIRSLGANHRSRIADHLLSLDDNDRYLRFGYLAHDAQIQKYVDGLDEEETDPGPKAGALTSERAWNAGAVRNRHRHPVAPTEMERPQTVQRVVVAAGVRQGPQQSPKLADEFQAAPCPHHNRHQR